MKLTHLIIAGVVVAAFVAVKKDGGLDVRGLGRKVYDLKITAEDGWDDLQEGYRQREAELPNGIEQTCDDCDGSHPEADPPTPPADHVADCPKVCTHDGPVSR